MENVVIVGSGISGLTAAIYAARANLEPIVLTGVAENGGQLMLTTEVENFPGFPDGVQGPDLIMKLQDQAKKFGAKLVQEDATGFEQVDGGYKVTAGDSTFEAKSIIISTGASARWLGLESEQKFKGRGVSTCATCDAYFYKDKEVIVVGGGDSMAEEGLFLTKFASKVIVVHRRDEFRASKIMQDRVMNHEKIEVVWDTEIDEILGEQTVNAVKLKNVKTGEITEKKIDGVFLAIGHIPNTKIFDGKIDLDEQGYVKTDRRMRTNLPGVFACGDVQDTIYKQAVTAAGSGCQAAIEAEKFVENIE